jgi:TatD DNase family protein
VLIDSHCHLQAIPKSERAAVLDRARKAGVLGFLVPAVDLEETDELLELAESESGVWLALGVHPHEANRWGDREAARLLELLRHPQVVAVGECGLDLHYQHAPLKVQEKAFRAQLEVASDAGFPVIVHHREAAEALLEILGRPEFGQLRFDFHSFAGGLDLARRLPAERSWFGVSGLVTFPNAANVREVFREMDRDRLLVETDTPYLAPVPYRGKRNEPAYLTKIVERLGEELGMAVEELAATTSANFFSLFSRAQRAGSES